MTAILDVADLYVATFAARHDAYSFDRLLLLRLFERTTCNVRTGCWEWQGGRAGSPIRGSAYGSITRGRGYERRVHRLGYELLVGPIPAGLSVLHHCDNKACWRPDHLHAGTHQDNMRDRSGARWPGNGRATWTHCRQGHPYSPENTIVSRRGRLCRTCRRATIARYDQRQSA